jgi:hypothetical protein
MAPREMSNTSPLAPQASEPCPRRHQNTFSTSGDLAAAPEKGRRCPTRRASAGSAPVEPPRFPSDSEAGVSWRFGEGRVETILGSGRESC